MQADFHANLSSTVQHIRLPYSRPLEDIFEGKATGA
jgi:hypothetical protein